MLECLSSQNFNGVAPKLLQKPSFPSSLSLPLEYSPGVRAPDKVQDLGIIGYVLQLIEIWKDSLCYVTGDTDKNDAPWLPNSTHFNLVGQVMEWESYLCHNHRSAHARFVEQDSAGLHQNQRYWNPWLLIQFTYHATHCLLNHPFFLSERIKSLVTPSSISFLETAFDLAALHARHIVRLIGKLEEKNYEVSDPFLGYCATVAATVHLRFCYVEDHGGKVQARTNFTKCYKFILRLGKTCPIAQGMVNRLR
jgi:hypothetical protein